MEMYVLYSKPGVWSCGPRSRINFAVDERPTKNLLRSPTKDFCHDAEGNSIQSGPAVPS